MSVGIIGGNGQFDKRLDRELGQLLSICARYVDIALSLIITPVTDSDLPIEQSMSVPSFTVALGKTGMRQALEEIVSRRIELNIHFQRRTKLAIAYGQVASAALLGDRTFTNAYTLPVDGGTFVEPVPFSELLAHNDSLQSDSLAYYQNALISSWQDFMLELYRWILQSGNSKNPFFLRCVASGHMLGFDPIDGSELTKRLDSFDKYNAKDKLKKLTNFAPALQNHSCSLEIITKHTVLRNALLHDAGIINAAKCQRAGVGLPTLLNSRGEPIELKDGDLISITFPELKSLVDAFNRILVDLSNLACD